MQHITIPPSKSHTMRALLFSLMAEGRSTIRNFLPSPDTEAMIQAISSLGARVEKKGDTLVVQGTAGILSPPHCTLNVGNSGQVLRFITAIAAISPYPIVLTGDNSITSNRPISPLIDALHQLGATTHYLGNPRFAPVKICGPIHSGTASLTGTDSQPVSGLLMALSFLSGSSELFVHDPCEQPWIDLTLWWLQRFGTVIERLDYGYYRIPGSLRLKGFDFTVPGDFSSAAFPMAASLITGHPTTLHHLSMDDPQGDKELFTHLQKQGGSFHFTENSLTVSQGTILLGGEIDVNLFIDAIPILSVLACYATSPTKLINARSARYKESDRLLTMSQELSKMRAKIKMTHDTLTIYPSCLEGASLLSHNDHRVAMALCVAALRAHGPSTIENTHCINKSYPQFVQHLQELGHAISAPTPNSLRISGVR
ncbi:MAG: 3-phosphoshikimate 1-carboxyvinyltransferase [Simkania sp.]|nr:3-phosphoshikimate 1-carboxyvinyltransferase [Simkania sp.]